jgi:hypothetical protein
MTFLSFGRDEKSSPLIFVVDKLCVISAMKIFLAGEVFLSKEAGWSAKVDGWQGALSTIIKRRLFSYFYHGYSIGNKLCKEIELSIDCKMDLFLDSGAFSAHNLKKTIAIDRYADFIHQHGANFSAIANLDDIGDTGPKSWENLKVLEANGCKVIPVFHYDDDTVYLKRMLDADYPCIALGGLVGSSHKVLREWLDRVWSNYLINEDGNPLRRVHGFGMTDFELMMRYPWYSIDSASWAMVGIYGGCVFYKHNKLFKIVFSDDSPSQGDLDGSHYNQLTEEEKAAVDTWLLPHKVTAKQCASHYSFRHLVNAATYQDMEYLGTDRFVAARFSR